MKKITIAFTLILACLILKAQTPNSFKYQALARTASGEIMANEAVDFTISILENSITGTSVYSEKHSVTTNQYGLVSFNIGEGVNPTSTFAEIDWTKGAFFVEIKLNGNLIGTSQLLSVPFAKFADKAGNAFSGNYNDLTNQPDLGLKLDTTATTNWDKNASDDFSGDFNDLNNKPIIDKDSLNEIQSLYVSPIGDTLFLSNSNYVIIPGISSVNEPNKNWEPGDNWFDKRDSVTYKTIKIGNQTWMQENLRATRYADGTPIIKVMDNSSWANLNYDDKAYCYYGNDSINYSQTYGVLYTWAAATESNNSDSNPSGVQGVCPTGWHIPSESEWLELRDYLGGYSIAGGKMKEIGFSFWSEPNTGATNDSGFYGLPGGYRSYSGGGFYEINTAGTWISTHSNTSKSESFQFKLNHNNSNLSTLNYYTNCGYSVRCVRD